MPRNTASSRPVQKITQNSQQARSLQPNKESNQQIASSQPQSEKQTQEHAQQPRALSDLIVVQDIPDIEIQDVLINNMQSSVTENSQPEQMSNENGESAPAQEPLLQSLAPAKGSANEPKLTKVCDNFGPSITS